MPPCVVETCAVRPVFPRVVRELCAGDPRKYPRGHEADACSGAHVEACGGSWESRHQQHLGPENQDSQHKLNQPRIVLRNPVLLRDSASTEVSFVETVFELRLWLWD